MSSSITSSLVPTRPQSHVVIELTLYVSFGSAASTDSFRASEPLNGTSVESASYGSIESALGFLNLGDFINPSTRHQILIAMSKQKMGIRKEGNVAKSGTDSNVSVWENITRLRPPEHPLVSMQLGLNDHGRRDYNSYPPSIIMPGDEPSLQELSVTVLCAGRLSQVQLTPDGNVGGLVTKKNKPLKVVVPVYDIIWAAIEKNELVVSFIRRGRRGKPSTLERSSFTFNTDEEGTFHSWCNAVMAAAYKGVSPQRRLRILVNPRGGPGKAARIYETIAKPIFEAAHCPIETTFTERAKHATDIAKSLLLDDLDALVLLSGDGLLHEIYNGFASHEDPMRAFSIPVAPIPTGSGNGMAINILGLQDGFDIGVACLNAIKGKPMKQDICSVTIGDQRIFNYFSVTLGLMADLDLGTEHLRWMGDTRFIVGFLQGVRKMKGCPITLEMKVSESSKDRMVEEFHARSEAHNKGQHTADADEKHDVGDDSLPKLKHTAESSGDEAEWTKFDKQLLYFYAGSAPFVGRDLMQFPVAHASDGLIDIVVQETTSRGTMLKHLGDGHEGGAFWEDTQHYFKASAYRITPHGDGNLAIDGERYELKPFTVECHRALGTLLSPTGRYATDFTVPKPGKGQGGATPSAVTGAETGRSRLCC